MQYGIVHGNANIVCERAGTEIRSIVDIAGFGTLAIDDALVHEFIDFQQIGTNFGKFLEDRAECRRTKRPAGFISSISFGVFSSIMPLTLLRTPYSAWLSLAFLTIMQISPYACRCGMMIIRFRYTVLSPKMDSVKP